MKKIVLSFLCLASLVMAAKAQPVLTGANSNPVNGDGFRTYYVDTNTVTKGASGPNVTWDFSAVSIYDEDSTLTYACPAAPHCGLFAGANIAQLNFGDYLYGNASSAKLSYIGYYSTGTAVNFVGSWDPLQYPFAYNNVYTDTYSVAVPADDYYYSETDSFIYDGYGTIILPTGTDTGVVRIRNITHFVDSSSAGATYGRTETYNWYKPGVHFPIFTIYYDSTGSVDTAGISTGEYYVYDASYSVEKPNKLAIFDINKANSSLSVYPNPVTDELHIQFTIQDYTSAKVMVTDAVGRMISVIDNTKIAKGRNDISYPVGDLAPGIYVVHLVTEEGSTSQKITITR